MEHVGRICRDRRLGGTVGGSEHGIFKLMLVIVRR